MALANVTVWKKSKIHSYEQYFVNWKWWFHGIFVKNSNVFVSTDCHFCTWKEKKMNEHAALEIVFRYFVPKIIVTTLQITKIVTHVISWNYAYLLKAKSYQIFSAVFISTLLCIAREVSQILTFVSNFFSHIILPFCFAEPKGVGWKTISF